MKKFVFQAIFLIIVIFLGLAIYSSKITNIPFIPVTQEEKKEVIIINNSRINVEVADNQEKRTLGLSGRDSLASNSGMLFVFPKEDKYPFWMKGLKFSLDFIWIRKSTVVDLLNNVPTPQPGQTDQSLPIYSSRVPVDSVLEVSGGTIERLNIKIGDKVQVVTAN